MIRSRVAIALVVASAVGCEREGERSPAPAPAGERVAAVAAGVDDRTLDDLCDVIHGAESAPEFAYPPLSSDSSRPPTRGWRWINLWATWCKPCVEEIPMLRDWADQLSADGLPIEIVFLSVDASAEAIDSYRRDHPDAPSDYRFADPEQVVDWVADFGLAGGATIPVHVVVDPEGNVLCLRSGKVYPRDFSLVERLLRGDG